MMSKDNILAELKKREDDGLRLCRLGLIDPRPECLCRLLHYAIGLDNECALDEALDKGGSQEPSQKKQKSEPVVVSWHVYYCCMLKVMLARHGESSK